MRIELPIISRYFVNRGVYRLMLAESFLNLLRGEGVVIDAGMSCGVVREADTLEFRMGVGKYILRASGHKLYISSKDFGPSIVGDLASHYRLLEVSPERLRFLVAPVTKNDDVEPVGVDPHVDDLRAALIEADEQNNYLQERNRVLVAAIKGLLPLDPLPRCEDCLERPDTESVFGYITCGCHNVETYNEWYARQTKLRKVGVQ